jgi:hypothetical protein
MLTACLDGPQNAVVSAIKPQEQSDSPISDSEHAAALQGFIRLPTA